MKYVHTRICPLCSKTLKQFSNGKQHKSFCQESYFRYPLEWGHTIYNDKPTKITDYKIREPHYSVTYQDDNFIQSTIIPPYWIRTYSQNNSTEIYKFPFKHHIAFTTIDPNLIMKVPIIETSDYTAEFLIKKIKNLLIFL